MSILFFPSLIEKSKDFAGLLGKSLILKLMEYKYLNVTDKNKHIDSFFEMESMAGGKMHKDLILPDCTPGLMFVENGNFSRNCGCDQSFFKPGVVYLFGQKTKAVEYLYPPSGLKAFGVKLKPSSIYQLFGIEASEINDTVIDIKDLSGSIKKPLELFYAQPTRNLHKIELILSCFKMDEINSGSPLLEALLSDIHSAKGEIAIQTLANKYNIGYKRMERLFKRYVGLTPKLYARIVRFYQCVVAGLQSKDNRLTDIAYQGGFYDQMHFIKETKRLTGKIPSDLFKTQHTSIEYRHITYLSQRGY